MRDAINKHALAAGVAVIATFHPQAWINDYAVDVDPEGETSWEVTPEFLADLLDDVGGSALESSTYESDYLRQDPNAPDWVRAWSGPFWVKVLVRETGGAEAAESSQRSGAAVATVDEPASSGGIQAVRCGHLLAALDGPYDGTEDCGDINEVIAGAKECPRYLIRSHTDTDDGRWFAFADDLADAEEVMCEGVTDGDRAWWPSALFDLDTGEEVDFGVEVIVRVAAREGEPR